MSKRVIKDGPQLTGAQALDAILASVDARLERAKAKGNSDDINVGRIIAYEYVRELVSVIRAEKFDDPATDNPHKAIYDSRSYIL